MSDKPQTKKDVLHAVLEILPETKLASLKGEIILKTGLKADREGKIVRGKTNLRSDRSPAEIGNDVAEDLFRALNWMGAEGDTIKGFLGQVSTQHRTLQQAFGNLLIACIKQFAQMHRDGHFDLRNEALCELCVKLEKQIEYGRLPFI